MDFRLKLKGLFGYKKCEKGSDNILKFEEKNGLF